jgi:predicted DNA-binding transcriptional regulator AlpA
MSKIRDDTATVDLEFLTPKETAAFLRMSESWLAKARMRKDGPPFIEIGRSIRYSKGALLRWLKSRER